MKTIALILLGIVASALAAPLQDPQPAPPRPVPIPNAQIDFPRFLELAQETEAVRAARRLTEAEFAAAIGTPGTVLLDARSADKYRARHIAGAVSLPFTDFTAGALAKVIPAKTTRVLIYCNNNFAGDVQAFPSKGPAASLNISTYIALATYGYENVWELGPHLDVKTSKLPWAGTAVAR
jgi:phage shock protein E